MTKYNHDIFCEVEGCKKHATKNIQNWYHEYNIDKDGNYDEINDWEGDTNYFLCNVHEITDL